MSGQRFAIIDPAAGASGDMLLGALMAVGADPAWLTGLPARLGLDGVTVEVTQTDRCGIAATKVTVRSPDGQVEGPAGEPEHGHSHDDGAHEHHHHHHHHHHDQHHHHGHGHGPHRHVGELLAIVERAPLSDWARDRALAAFRLLGEAEGRVHGVAPERVSLHEVGALDALVDIVGTIEGFERLGLTTIYSRPVALGSGWVRAAHGTLPVPAPATAMLAEGLAIGPDGPVTGEATTPTGAVLLRVLSSGAPPGEWRAVQSGWGAGTRNPAGYPNALRVLVAEPAAEAAEAVVLATDLDDMSPEYLAPLREALMAAGAVDVVLWSTQMKKDRLGFRVEAVAPASRAEAVAAAFFDHSTTAGIRQWRAARTTLARHELSVETREGASVRVKVVDAPSGARAKPEFDDVRRTAVLSGRPALQVAAETTDLAYRTIRGREQAHKESS